MAAPCRQGSSSSKTVDQCAKLLSSIGDVLLRLLSLQGLLSWNHDGSLLASASQKGTVVRVHAMPSAATTHSLR
jgi:autophagy-related protein 18